MSIPGLFCGTSRCLPPKEAFDQRAESVEKEKEPGLFIQAQKQTVNFA